MNYVSPYSVALLIATFVIIIALSAINHSEMDKCASQEMIGIETHGKIMCVSQQDLRKP